MAKVLRFFFISTIIFATLFFIFFNLYFKAQLSGLPKRIKDLELRLQESESKNSDLLQELTLKESELSDLKHKYEERISRLENVLKAKEKEIEQLNSQMEALNKKVGKSESVPCPNNDYLNLILGDVELSKGKFVKSAEFFEKVDVSDIDLGGLKGYYEKRKERSFEKAGRELYLQGLKAFESKKYREAINYFLKSLKYSNKEIYYFDDLLYYLGLAYFRIDNYIESLSFFKKLLHTYQFSDYTDESLLKVAQIYEKLGDLEDALFYYKLLKSYGYSKIADKKIEEIQKRMQR